MKLRIAFIGKTSSMLGSKYQIVAQAVEAVAAVDAVMNGKVVVTPAVLEVIGRTADEVRLELQKAAEAEGVQFNANVGVGCFISQTHLHLTPEVGKEADVDLKGFEKAGRIINYFAGIDKVRQEAFAKSLAAKRSISGIVIEEGVLEDLNSTMNIEVYRRITRQDRVADAEVNLLKKKLLMLEGA